MISLVQAENYFFLNPCILNTHFGVRSVGTPKLRLTKKSITKISKNVVPQRVKVTFEPRKRHWVKISLPRASLYL